MTVTDDGFFSMAATANPCLAAYSASLNSKVKEALVPSEIYQRSNSYFFLMGIFCFLIFFVIYRSGLCAKENEGEKRDSVMCDKLYFTVDA